MVTKIFACLPPVYAIKTGGRHAKIFERALKGATSLFMVIKLLEIPAF
jgi:hypothetical protein